ncbi:hypothetical protein ACFW5D_35415 [Streptomyces sp. NPDC058770]|uniref:hypothetical protein n=1 Tax=unclassified Streptomyces TaxID=2593676 RepID=UPI0036C786D9
MDITAADEDTLCAVMDSLQRQWGNLRDQPGAAPPGRGRCPGTVHADVLRPGSAYWLRHRLPHVIAPAARGCPPSLTALPIRVSPSVLPTLLFGMSEPFVGLAHPGGPGVAFSPLPSVAGADSPPGPHDDSAAH